MTALVLALALTTAPATQIEVLANNDAVMALPAFHAKGTHVIHFWASWCEPCLEELPQFFLEARELAKQGVDFTFISADDPDDLSSLVIPLLTKLDGFFPGAHHHIFSADVDPDTLTTRVSPHWKQATIPTTFVFRDGKRVGDFHSLEDLAAVTSPARRSPSPAPHPSR